MTTPKKLRSVLNGKTLIFEDGQALPIDEKAVITINGKPTLNRGDLRPGDMVSVDGQPAVAVCVTR